MKHEPVASKRRVNLLLDADVLTQARDIGLNLSQVSEQALRAATKAEHDRRWKEQNRDVIEAWNDWVETHELPLEKHRLF